MWASEIYLQPELNIRGYKYTLRCLYLRLIRCSAVALPNNGCKTRSSRWSINMKFGARRISWKLEEGRALERQGNNLPWKVGFNKAIGC